jgi:transcription antitermination factor NusG
MMMAKPELGEREADALRRGRQKAELINWLRGEAASRDGEMAWYVARTRWRADSVADELRRAGIEAVCPLYRHWKRHTRSNRRYSVEIPLLGNHAFVHLLKAESAWVGVLTFDGVECLLGTGERPVPVTAAEMAKVMEMLDVPHFCPVEQTTGLALGDTVVHPLGVMAELRGTVVEIDADKREALISTVLFGREMSTRCAIDDLEKLS